MAKTLIIKTPHGEFTRTTGTAYTHAVVRSCPRAMEAFEASQNDPENTRRWKGGVTGRWAKDRGFAVTWHKSEASARSAASKPYGWSRTSTVLGVFAVEV